MGGGIELRRYLKSNILPPRPKSLIDIPTGIHFGQNFESVSYLHYGGKMLALKYFISLKIRFSVFKIFGGVPSQYPRPPFRKKTSKSKGDVVLEFCKKLFFGDSRRVGMELCRYLKANILPPRRKTLIDIRTAASPLRHT